MISEQKFQQQLIEHFPFLKSATPDFQRIFFNTAIHAQIPAGQTIAETGAECTQLALVLHGSVRVFKIASKGREITLYRINDGDSCVLTASCLISHTPFPAIAEAETDLEAIIIPANFAKAWMTQYQPWGEFVFSLISRRLAEVITVLENVTFHRLDERIAAYLLDRSDQNDTLITTHHDIAADLGTSREVVSRTLKDFDKQGWISMSRGEINIINRPKLKTLAENLDS